MSSGKAAYPAAFFIAIAAALVLFLGFQSLFSTLPLYILSIGGSSADTGLATWVFALAALLIRPPAGVLTDRWPRKPILVCGAFLFGCSPLLYALSSSVPLLLGARALHGVGIAFFTTAYQALIADLLPRDRYGEGLGLANVASMVPMAVAPLLGEWVVAQFDFGTLFLAAGVLGGVGGLVTLGLPGQGRAERLVAPVQPGPRQALRQPGVRVGSLGMALLGIPFGAFIVFLPLLVDARGLRGAGWVYMAFALATSLAQPLAGRIADRWGVGGVVLTGLALVSLSTIGLAASASLWALIGLASLLGLGNGTARAGLDAYVQQSVDPGLRGSAAALQYTAFDLLIGLGSWGLGCLADVTSYGVMYTVVGGITLLGVLVGALLGRRL